MINWSLQCVYVLADQKMPSKPWRDFFFKITFTVQNYQSYSICSVFYHDSLKANIEIQPTWKWFLKGVQPTNLTNIWLNQRPLETAEAGTGDQLLKWQPIIKLPLAWDTVIPQMFAVYEIWESELDLSNNVSLSASVNPQHLSHKIKLTPSESLRTCNKAPSSLIASSAFVSSPLCNKFPL